MYIVTCPISVPYLYSSPSPLPVLLPLPPLPSPPSPYSTNPMQARYTGVDWLQQNLINPSASQATHSEYRQIYHGFPSQGVSTVLCTHTHTHAHTHTLYTDTDNTHYTHILYMEETGYTHWLGHWVSQWEDDPR